MGLFKFLAGPFGLGVLPIRPTTGRERARKYQREANDLLEKQLHAIQDLAQPQTPSDGRPRGTCPACLEMMLAGASTCPHCHTTGITWPQLNQKAVSTEVKQPEKTTAQKTYKEIQNACSKCGGKVIAGHNSKPRCMGKGCKGLKRDEYPHLFPK
jgi:hypothetical protein